MLKRGINRVIIYRDDRYRKRFLELLEAAIKRQWVFLEVMNAAEQTRCEKWEQFASRPARLSIIYDKLYV